MGEITVIAVIYLIAILILVAEIFIPSHGILTIAGITFLVVAVVKTYFLNERAGVVAMIGSAVVVPAAMVLAVKIWPRTPMGRAIAPHNPVASSRDVGVDVEGLHRMVGCVGRCVSPLRPVGTCDFDGRRFQCVSEMGLVEAGAQVQVVGIQGGSLSVVARRESTAA